MWIAVWMVKEASDQGSKLCPRCPQQVQVAQGGNEQFVYGSFMAGFHCTLI